MTNTKRVKVLAILSLTMLLIAFVPAVFSASPASSKSTDPMANPFTGVLVAELKGAPLADQPGNGQLISSQQSQLQNFIQSNNLNIQIREQFSVLMNGFALQLNNVVPNTLLQSGVVSAVYPATTYHTDMDVSPSVIGLSNLLLSTDLGLWALLGGHQNAGLGMKIGIIDTGIDQSSTFLTDSTLPTVPGFPKCDALDSSTGTPDQNCMFVSNKIIVAKVFQSAYGTSFDAHAAQDHGTHVSGIAAGVFGTTAPLTGSRILSGVAPRAYLGNYNVFPGTITNAFDVDIIAALEAALADGMNVVNLSLGGSPSINDPLARAVNRVAVAGMIPVIAAGNAGPGLFTIESPGTAMRAITAGASTDPHFFGITVTHPTLGSFGAALGSFANFIPAVAATYATTSPSTACSTLTPGSLTGEIALIQRGTCTFSTKIRNAQNAGALGVIVYDSAANQFEDPIAMGQDGTPSQPTIPAVFISRANGLAMVGAATKTVNVDGTVIQEFLTSNGDFMASFSSRGPTPTPPQPFAIKPDVVAPGVNVYSSVPGGFAVFQGTSMATPHVAGAAALVKQLHPDWNVGQVKSALVNSAARPVHLATSGSLTTSSVLARGGGRIDLSAAGLVTATLYPVSVTFASLAGTPGQSVTKSVAITSVSGSSITYSLSTAPVQVIVTSSAADGATGQITLSLSTNSITLSPGDSTTFTITLTSVSGTVPNFYQSDIIISGGTVTLKVPLFVWISSP